MSAIAWFASMLVASVGLALVVAWLAGHRRLPVRIVSALLGTTTAIYCSAVVIALIADNRADLARIKLPGLLSILAFTVMASSVAVGWTRGGRSSP
jgi:hypothetical protein